MRIAFNDAGVEEFNDIDFVVGTDNGGKSYKIAIWGERARKTTGEYIGEVKKEFESEAEAENYIKPLWSNLLKNGWLDLSENEDIEIY